MSALGVDYIHSGVLKNIFILFMTELNNKSCNIIVKIVLVKLMKALFDCKTKP